MNSHAQKVASVTAKKIMSLPQLVDASSYHGLTSWTRRSTLVFIREKKKETIEIIYSLFLIKELKLFVY
jgi:hypothetical protein